MSPEAHFSISKKGEHTLPETVNTDAIMAYLKTVKSIRRSDGRIDQFQPDKIRTSIRAAFLSAGFSEDKDARHIDKVLSYVIHKLTQRFDGHTVPTTENVRETIASGLIDTNFVQVARKYLLY
ncbi:MAG: ATP cone domain-containing protein, partial [Patescibacteria group bacterium]